MSTAAYLHHCAAKVAHWEAKAESATTRKKALKALRKYAKWSNRLAEFQTAIRSIRGLNEKL